MILVTGGAGFIGSCLQAELFSRGYETVIVDRLGSEGKWRNIARHPPSRIIAPEDLDDWLGRHPPIEMVFHMAAISETLAIDGDEVWRTNVELSLKLWEWCANRSVRFVYASSAATYGVRRGGLRRRPGTAVAPVAAQSLWLVEACLRRASHGPARTRRAAAAAMGRAQVLQRLWPQRVSQGPDDLRGKGQIRRAGCRRPEDAPVPQQHPSARRRHAVA